MENLSTFYFLLTALLILGGALGVLFFKKVMHAALSLILSLMGVAFFMLLNSAEAAAWSQIMVYVGGVVVLIIFGIFFTNAQEDSSNFRGRKFFLPIIVLLFSLVAFLFLHQNSRILTLPNHEIKAVGLSTLTHYLLIFELLALLLTLALIGVSAIVSPQKHKN